MKKTALLLAAAIVGSITSVHAASVKGVAVPAAQPFKGSVLTDGLDFPWEITVGPDGFIWVTERAGKRVTRVDSKTGKKHVAVTIGDAFVGPQHEGVLGMALHPDLLKKGGSNNFVYVAYTYNADPSGDKDKVDRRLRVVRFTYTSATEKLSDPVDVITNIPGGDDHQGARLKFGPDDKLYLTVGDHGHNQFGNFLKLIQSQDLPTANQVADKDWTTYAGKILRVNLDGSIPEDNPAFNGVKSHVFAYGFRNPQGIVFGSDGKLYESEQGPKTDDEVNLIQGGKNYGWPRVAGYRDGQGYVYAAWGEAPSTEKLEFSDYEIPASVPQYKETDWNHPDFVEPLKTFYTVPNSYNFKDQTCSDMPYMCWPTIAPSSIDYYPGGDKAIPGWGNTLLVPSLKNGTLYKMRLSADGKSVQGDVYQVFDTVNRYRDVAISPDQKTIYIATDSGNMTRDDATGKATTKLANPGAILKFTYTGK